MGCKLERVNDYVCSHVCFEKLWTTGDFRVIGNLCACEDQTATQTSFSHRDRLLLKMTLIQRVFKKVSDNQYNCAHLWKICEALITECNLLTDLIACLESCDHLVAFSACKSLVKVVLGLPLSSMKTVWFKENLLNFDNKLRGTKEHPWRLLYTMEFLRQIVRFCHGNQDAVPVHTGPEVNICDCGTPKQKYSVSKCTLINMILACDKWMHILPLYMPFWNDLWRDLLQELERQDLETRFSIYSNVSSAIHQKTLSPHGLDENTLVSFLGFLLEVVKYIQKDKISEISSLEAYGGCADMFNYIDFSVPDQQNLSGSNLSNKCEADPKDQQQQQQQQQQQLFTTEVLLKVIPALIFLLHLPSLSTICFKSVLNVLRQLFLPNLEISPCHNSTRSHLLVLQSSAALIAGVHCCLLKNIPQTTGCSGFGGQEWRSLSDKTTPKADPVCVRKLSILLLKSSYAVLQYGAEEPEGVVFNTIMSWSSNLKHLVHGRAIELETSNTSSRQHSCEEGMSSEVLIQLFSNQDDELVEVLLVLLKIYQKVQSFTDEQQHSWSSFLHLFNPHALFMSLLDSVCFDHSVLLDFLISPETCFLSYLLMYLRFMFGNWRLFSSSMTHCEEVTRDEVSRESPKLFNAIQDHVKEGEEEEERHCPALYSHLPLSSENASGSKEEDFCRTETFILPREPSIYKGDSSTKRRGQARHVELSCLQDIARAYESESSEESDEDDVCIDQMDADTLALGISSCGKIIEEADTSRNITVKKKSHYCEPNTDMRGNCVSVSRCEQFTLEDTNEVTEVESAGAEPRGGDFLDGMDRLMAVLIRLRLSVERLHQGGLFPYNAEPLLRSMRTVERLYDGC